MSKIQAIRGMNDILPENSPAWRFLEESACRLFEQYGIDEIRLPIVESTELFKRSIGEVTDIVEKEMYTFEDRNGDSLTLRPEGTAGVVRACQEHGLLYNQTQRLWYTGPMFRHERPQKGRYRQFHQIGVECFGFAGPDVDAELIVMTHRLWEALGLADRVTLQINSLGTAENRAAYRQALVDYLTPHQKALDEDSQRRLSTNPLRILDTKDPGTRDILVGAPTLMDFLDEDSLAHFDGLKKLLDACGVAYEVNPALVRGLDYYGLTVFEWVTDALGAQGTVCAGGRYDGLVTQLGGKPCPAVGFAMGIERLVLLMETLGTLPSSLEDRLDFYVVAVGEDVQAYALEVAEKIRRVHPLARVMLNHGGGSFKSQMKRADRSTALYTLIIGEQEKSDETVGLKYLRAEKDQQTLSVDDLVALAASLI